MGLRTGLNESTPDRILIDAGAVYLNYGLTNERLLGATRGGNEFALNRVIRDIEVDGVMGSTKGLRRVTEVKPQLTCNLIELSLDNFVKSIAGSVQSALAKQTAIEGEYVAVGDTAKVNFDLDNDNIVPDTEKIFINGTELTRSKKYDSRFVGDNEADNKNFVLGVGDWVKGNASDALDIEAGGHDGNCMRFTGSATSIEAFLTLPGGNGAQLTNLVVGEHYKIKVALKKGTFTPTITVSCDAGSKALIAPTTSWVVHVIEFVASGTDASIVLTGSVAPSDTEELYVSYLELEKVDGDYVINWDEGEVIFPEDDIPTAAEYIVAGYTYYTGATATHDIINGGQIADSDYISNVALVGNVSGKDEPIICIVTDALADTGLTLSTAPRDESVPTVVFTGHYDPEDPDTEPWSIHYPRL